MLLPVVYVIVVWLTDHMVWGMIIPVLAVPPLTGILDEDITGAMLLLDASVVVLTRHADSFARLREHWEPSLRGAVQGKFKNKA